MKQRPMRPPAEGKFVRVVGGNMAQFSWQLGLISGCFVRSPGPADPYDGAHSTDFDGFGLQLSTCDTASCPFPQYKATQQLECAL